MIAEKMQKLVNNNLTIRQMFEEGKRLKQQYGEENVYDFSLGNPSVEPPIQVNEAVHKYVEDENIHAYMSNGGYEEVRKKIANSLNKNFETNYTEKNIIMSVGAAGGLNVVLKTILNPEEEVIVFVPYFMEYRDYIENYGGKIVEVLCHENFEPNLEDFEKKINSKTKAIIINSPNNPSGIIYSEEVIKELTDILRKKEKEFHQTIYLISDEPYRQIVYDNHKVPYLTKYYDDTIVVYCYSKSLSIPGERIGYIAVANEVNDSEDVILGCTIATRILGFVNAPSLMQKVISECLEITSDMSEYEQNRDILYDGLVKCGYECQKPQGTFYLFLKSPIENEKEFCSIAKKYHILMVPGSSFSYPGYVRLAFCTKSSIVQNSIQKFKELMEEINHE